MKNEHVLFLKGLLPIRNTIKNLRIILDAYLTDEYLNFIFKNFRTLKTVSFSCNVVLRNPFKMENLNKFCSSLLQINCFRLSARRIKKLSWQRKKKPNVIEYSIYLKRLNSLFLNK